MKLKFEIKKETYHVKSDERQFILYKNPKIITDNNGTEREVITVIGYYPKIIDLFNGLLNLSMRKSDATNIKEVFLELKELRKDIARLVAL